jgi:hypothetical protein
MTVVETSLIYVGAPVLLTAVIASLVYGMSPRRGPRYRPGMPFLAAPVWFLAHDLESGGRAALPSAGESPAGVTNEEKGGARGEW